MNHTYCGTNSRLNLRKMYYGYSAALSVETSGTTMQPCVFAEYNIKYSIVDIDGKVRLHRC